MKDETHGIPIQEFVGLKSKMYYMIYEEDGKLTEKKTAKGIKYSVIKHHTKHDHYEECLFDRTVHCLSRIRSDPTIISYTISPSINLDCLHLTINGIF